MRILVTGGAGFIGSTVCRFLIRETDAEVVNLDKLTYAGNLDSLRTVRGDRRYRFIKADICDGTAISHLFDDVRPDAVMHLAAESHVDRSITGSRSFIETNILGTYTMLEASHLRSTRHYLQMLQQLWSLSIPGEAHPVNDSERVRGQATARLWQWLQCPRLALCRGSRQSAASYPDQGLAG